MNGSLALAVAIASTSLVVIGCGILIVVAARRAAPLQKARRQAIAAMCAQRGLVPSAANLARDFAMLPAIERQGLVNLFSSPDGGVAAADLVRGSGNNVAFFSVLTFTVPGLNVPSVSVQRRDVLGTTVLGGPPLLELESGEFDKRFAVRAADRRSAVMLLDQGMMQWLLDCDQVSFVMVGDRVVASVNRATEPAHQASEPVEFELLFKFWDGFIARLPALLRTEYVAP